jgi:hypothetical protein
MENSADLNAARELAVLALSHVGRVPGREPLHALLWRATNGRLGRRRRSQWTVLKLGTPWQDTPSWQRVGWRERAAYLRGHEVFAVDYQVCRRCALGWVEEPATDERYQRCGLAAAGLAALRVEHPGLEWHTRGDHMRDAKPFWSAVGAGVAGGYQSCDACPHLDSG